MCSIADFWDLVIFRIKFIKPISRVLTELLCCGSSHIFLGLDPIFLFYVDPDPTVFYDVHKLSSILLVHHRCWCLRRISVPSEFVFVRSPKKLLNISKQSMVIGEIQIIFIRNIANPNLANDLGSGGLIYESLQNVRFYVNCEEQSINWVMDVDFIALVSSFLKPIKKYWLLT
jgi:hypothetical protein